MTSTLKATIVPHAIIACPHCHNDLDIEWHVKAVLDNKVVGNFTPTSCKDCDKAWELVINSREDIHCVEKPIEQWQGLMLVKQASANVHLVLEQTFYADDGKPRIDLTYWIDQHTCPTNWLPVLAVAAEGNFDPHGVFEFVRAVTFAEIHEEYGYTRHFLRGDTDDNISEENALHHIFPEIKSGEEGN